MLSLYKFRSYFFTLGEVEFNLNSYQQPHKMKSGFFLANKSLGTVHTYAFRFSRKELILWYKISKKFKQIDPKMPLLVPKTF